MQKVAAYLLERRDGLDTAEARLRTARLVREQIESWLRSKGAENPAEGGVYRAEDRSDATFSVERAEADTRSWTMYRLEEVSSSGRCFVATVSVTAGSSSVFVYATLEVGGVATKISPIEVDPRCPRLIGQLLDADCRWYHGSSPLSSLKKVEGFNRGVELAAELADPDRRVPFVVVSVERGYAALPYLAEKVAYDLAGLANVCTVDPAASWGLTDSLGKALSCYQGGIRIYWPQFRTTDRPYKHPLWTAARLLDLSSDPKQARDRICRQLRKMIMRASALSTVRPREIDEIREASRRAEFERLTRAAKSAQDWRELAELYDEENDKLKADIKERDEEIGFLQEEITSLEAKVQALLHHLKQAQPDLSLKSIAEGEDDVEPDVVEPDQEQAPPEPGEVRFYKKKYSAPTHDVMMRVADCRHNAWQNAAKADKAKKGIAKLEGGRSDWKTIQHCGTCTGGGMWRVRW